MKRNMCPVPIPLVLMILFVQVNVATAADKRVLTGVFEPEMIRAAAGELYVVEGSTVLVYSLRDLSLSRKIGRQGEGPGEFRVADFWYNTATVLPERIFIDGYDKVAYFAPDGKLLRELRKPVGIGKLVPAGNNYAGVKLDHVEGEIQFQCLYLLGPNLEFKTELCRQESPVQAMTRRIEMIPDVLNFAVWDNRIYVEKSREGFVIEIFGSEGGRLGRIENPTPQMPVTQKHKDEAVENVRNDPFVKRMGYEAFARFSQFAWPRALPAIRDFVVADERIYVRTPQTREGEENWLILDLAGRPLGSAFLPRMEDAPLMAHLSGVNYFTIHQKALYFIRDNERTEEWELHVEEIEGRPGLRAGGELKKIREPDDPRHRGG